MPFSLLCFLVLARMSGWTPLASLERVLVSEAELPAWEEMGEVSARISFQQVLPSELEAAQAPSFVRWPPSSDPQLGLYRALSSRGPGRQ